ncbi:MAG: RecQ family ATP-dependent DNA helicase [Bacteroidetes bacterium]|nr:MAG: RecQ family ATP-dependent DNA helicase [Bacteroidota bacterium]
MDSIAFFDLEASSETGKILDIGSTRSDEAIFHGSSANDFIDFTRRCEFLCGHNILKYDLLFLQSYLGNQTFGIDRAIDTLLLSPLLFPKKPYHRLLKDDKIQTEERNNPYNDSVKAKELFFDELAAFNGLNDFLKTIFYNLLYDIPGYGPFFKFARFNQKVSHTELETLVRNELRDKICEHCDLARFIQKRPISLAYTLSLIGTYDRYSITPPWVLKNYSDVEQLLLLLCNTPCLAGCTYCNEAFNPLPILKNVFGFPGFRKYENEPLQENAVNAAINNKSLLAIFPTGGGKSVTFQLPALMSGQNARALTVVISPLQSLMKDQVDNLDRRGITEAVTINGLLDPIDRSKAIERVENGNACILYISPESLRSITIERLLLKRKIARFVIDEAHCFSSWGQDFRVDYLYIAEFIKQLQGKKNLAEPIPVSCFTATAKQKVIEDIRTYFKENLNLTLEVFRANSFRTNLHYSVYQKDTEEDKYNKLREIIEAKDCPAIVYVSRTKKAYKLAERLSYDGFSAKPYYGKMDKKEKTSNQTAFMDGNVNIIVATSAFGMGVDKSDVGAVIHYDISDSLENYIQEAGRAGRDENMEADCFVLFNEEDLDKHFILLNQTKINSKEINQVWKAIKDLTRTRDKVSNSALEIARKAGWDDSINEIETRVVTAIAALEDAGYLKRGQNMPRVFANSILSKTAQDAIDRINVSEKIEPSLRSDSIRIIKKLFSSKSKRLSTEEQAESRVDYISDQLGIVKERVIRIIELLREENILAQTKDLTAFVKKGESNNRSHAIADSFRKLEDFFLSVLKEEENIYHIKEINEKAIEFGIKESTVAKIKAIINFWAIKNWVKRHYPEGSKNHVQISLLYPVKEFGEKLERRHLLARLITDYLYKKSQEIRTEGQLEEVLIEFSVQELKEMSEAGQGLYKFEVSIDDVEDTLFYLSRIEAIKIEGGFLVIHNRLSVDRIEKNNRIQYKESDYEKLGQFYRQKVQQIHIVGEYAKKMIRNYNEALKFVDDYFNLNYSSFLKKYFPGSREDEINRTLTPEKFVRLFGELSPNQLEIINDKDHQYIVVAAGPGSGKTRVLVHKLASLLLAEDVKHEQLLMLTFSRAAATEFKKRLIGLIGNAAAYIEIKTFHSYCFDLLGRVGTLEQADNILKTAVEKIKSGDIEISRITKAVLVVDEAQDMNGGEYELVTTLMDVNEEMRVILVGDDDQNIYGFRGADSQYMQRLITEKNAAKYELTENYRSKANIVDFVNQWAETIEKRLKTQPGFAHQADNGHISITQYTGNNLVVPLSTAIQRAELIGSTCILTKTNEEAMLLTGLMLKSSLPAKLIQSNDGFNLYNLYELRYFSDLLLKNEDSPVISIEEWGGAIRQLATHARQSNKLELALNVIKEFESVNEKRKYKSDWKAFLTESKVEDFGSISNEIIYVSTIHKAKGKEFDNLYLLLNQFRPNTDEQRRQVYVAITRAKANLHIHYNETFLRAVTAGNLTYQKNNDLYPEPEHLAYSLSHQDINLGYFEYVQQRMNGLRSGTALTILNDGLGNSDGQLVVKYSRNFQGLLQNYLSKGYELKEAKVNFVVYWKDQKENKESKIILPEIYLKRASNNMVI